MDQKKFLARILPPSGGYYVAKLKNKRLTQQKCSSLEDVALQILAATKSRADVYVATGSFSTSRKIEDCTGKCVLYVDIDCKIGGQYPTKAAAKAAIREAIKRGLPAPTMIIDSGGGFHLYWVLDGVMFKTEWKELAETLTYACAECRLNIDKGISTDAARILRVPGTINYKEASNPRVCEIIYENDYDYAIDVITERLSIFKKDKIVEMPHENDDLSGGLNDQGFVEGAGSPLPPVPPAAGMLENCPVFAANMETHGEHTAEVVWHKIIHTLAYTSDGEKYIHEVSKGHDSYTPHGTNAKWEWANRQKSRAGLGPSKCSTFEESGAAECAECPLRGKGKSPISLAYRAVPTPPGTIPFPYRNGATGVEQYDGENWNQVLPEKITDFVATLDPGVTTHLEFKYGNQKASFEMHEVQNGQAATTALSRFGLHLKRHHVEHLDSVVHSFMQDLQRSGKLEAPLQSYGWMKKEGFHAGGQVFGAPSYEGNIKIDVTISSAYEPLGELKVWQECANHILGQDRYAVWTVLASAFASPLLTFTGAEGSLISIVSAESGTGKSTAVQVAQAVWGHPKDGVAHLDDTPNSVVNRLGILNNLPAYWDEVRGKDEADKFVKMIFRLSQGKDKQRLNSNIQQRKAGHWSTIMTVATNEPVREHIARTVGNSDAGAARVFEIYASQKYTDNMSDGAARAFYHRCHENYGHMGQVYAKYLGENKDAAKALVTKLDDFICKKFNTTGDERFWVATIASLLAGALLANRTGAIKFDVPKLQEYLFTQFLAMRAYKHKEFATGKDNAVEMLKQYLMLKTDYACWAERMPKRGLQVSQLGFKMASDRRPTVIRYATEDKAVRIAITQFREWIYEVHGAGAEEIIKDLVKQGAKIDRGRIDTGDAKANGARLQVMDIPFTGSFNDLDIEAPDDEIDNTDLGAL